MKVHVKQIKKNNLITILILALCIPDLHAALSLPEQKKGVTAFLPDEVSDQPVAPAPEPPETVSAEEAVGPVPTPPEPEPTAETPDAPPTEAPSAEEEAATTPETPEEQAEISAEVPAEDVHEPSKQEILDQLDEQTETPQESLEEESGSLDLPSDKHVETSDDGSEISSVQDIEKEADPLNVVYLGDSLRPWEIGDPDELIEFDFDNAELTVLVAYIEKRFGLTFIIDDQLKPMPQGGKSILGTKVSFRTHQPLSKKQAWDIFVSFLDMAGVSPQPLGRKGLFKLTTNAKDSPFSISKGPLPTFIGVDPSLIPQNDVRIRYVYFVENASLGIIEGVINSMISNTAPRPIPFPELRAIIMCDKATNIRAILEIIRELDRVNMPETLAVIKLKRADATKVVQLYQSLIGGKQDNSMAAKLFGARKSSTKALLSDAVRIIAEPRTNSLILLGSMQDIKSVEEFVQIVDRSQEASFSPLYVYQLKYVDAESVAKILNEAVDFKKDSDAAKVGGVRDGEKYFKQMSITPEPSGNRLVINADYEDYLKIYETLQRIDVEQPQVAIRVLIVNVDVTQDKDFGVQMRNKKPGLDGFIGDSINFQTSGLDSAAGPAPVIENTVGTGATRLLGNLVQLASSTFTGAPALSPGATYMTLGSDMYGVWGMLRVLETYTRISVVANPFLVTTHKFPAIVKLGETRRVQTGTVFGVGETSNTIADLSANLEVKITPQISYEGFITLNVEVNIEQFTSTTQTSGNRTIKTVKTNLLVANKDVVALGGLIRETIVETTSKVPILGNVPILGWLFKNKSQDVVRESLVILICPQVIPPNKQEIAHQFTKEHLNSSRKLAQDAFSPSEKIDPIHRWFFQDSLTEESRKIDEFSDAPDRYIDENTRKLMEHERNEKKLAEHPRKKLNGEAIKPATPKNSKNNVVTARAKNQPKKEERA